MKPEKVDNSNLIDTSIKTKHDPDRKREHQNLFLKSRIVENSDYLVIPIKVFEFLKETYGCDEEILRYPIEVRPDEYSVEVMLKRVTFMTVDGENFKL